MWYRYPKPGRARRPRITRFRADYTGLPTTYQRITLRITLRPTLRHAQSPVALGAPVCDNPGAPGTPVCENPGTVGTSVCERTPWPVLPEPRGSHTPVVP